MRDASSWIAVSSKAPVVFCCSIIPFSFCPVLSIRVPEARIISFFATSFVLLPLSLHDRRERGRDTYDYHSIDNQCHACDLTDLPTERKRLLSVDECCQECHHCDIHDAKWKEEHKQEPAASETVGSVKEPHTEGTTISITPGTQDELQRRPAFRQAHVLERRQLIEASHHQQGTTNTGGISHEPH